jgi:hypothetical protein
MSCCSRGVPCERAPVALCNQQVPVLGPGRRHNFRELIRQRFARERRRLIDRQLHEVFEFNPHPYDDPPRIRKDSAICWFFRTTSATGCGAVLFPITAFCRSIATSAVFLESRERSAIAKRVIEIEAILGLS